MVNRVCFCFTPPNSLQDSQSSRRSCTVHLYASPSDSQEQVEDLRILKENCAKVMKPVWRNYPCAADPEDVVGDSLLAFLKSRRAFKPSRNAKFTTYAYKAVRNAVADRSRFEAGNQRSRRRRYPSLRGSELADANSKESRAKYYKIKRESELVLVDDDGDEIPAFEWIAGCEEQGYKETEYSDVREFVQKLPPRQRKVTEMVFWDGFSPAEAARALGISRAAVSDLLQKVYAKGKEELFTYKPDLEHTSLAV